MRKPLPPRRPSTRDTARTLTTTYAYLRGCLYGGVGPVVDAVWLTADVAALELATLRGIEARYADECANLHAGSWDPHWRRQETAHRQRAELAERWRRQMAAKAAASCA